MAKIQKLPQHFANLIAAGEVVERPGSVVKELIENALDASATRITLEIKNGGVSYIRVTDDGEGITSQDVRTAFMRHATSKIKTEGDLAAISTLGFRGEALAAVAAVSKVDMFTKTRHSAEGVQITLEGGEEKLFTETGCPNGTTIVIRDLFYNVPARAKFLKKDSTEASHIELAILEAAIVNCSVCFKFIKDGKEVFTTPGDGKMKSAIYALAGKETANSLLAVKGQLNGVNVDGYISSQTFGRANRNMQHFFVNRRPVRSRIMSAAVEQAYKSRMMTGRYPACYIGLQLHPSMVDVNVHPSKLEVKFAREKEIFSVIYAAAMSALDHNDSISAPTGIKTAEPVIQEGAISTAYQTSLGGIEAVKSGGSITLAESFPSASMPLRAGPGAIYKTRRHEEAEAAPPSQPAPTEVEPPGAPAPRLYQPTVDAPPREVPIPAAPPSVEAAVPAVVGEVMGTYILASDSDGLWLIDKHAAHERIIYNSLSAREREGVEGQVLLSPAIISLSQKEKDIVLQNAPSFEKAGFLVEDFGPGSVAVRQAPTYMEEKDIGLAISDMAGRLLEEKPLQNMVFDSLINSMACKAAIKANSQSSLGELRDLAARVFADPAVRNCPHGRPVLIKITKRDIEKLFGRTK